MIEAAGITLREAIEAILVIFIMAAYLEKTGEADKKRYVYAGALVAVLLSIALAVGLSAMGIDPENELAEGVLFIAAGLLVASLVVWMWGKAKTIKQEVEAKVAAAAGGTALALVAFVMVFREGVETVIFLQSLLLAGASALENLLGAIFGIALALGFGVVFLRGTARINLPRFFRVTSAILAVLVVKLIASGFHEFFEVGLLPSNEALLAFVGFFARDSTGALIILVMLLALVGMVIYDIATSRLSLPEHLSGAERRRLRYEFAKEKYSKLALGAVLLITSGVLLAPAVTASDVLVPEPIPLEASGDEVRIPVPEEEGLYVYSVGEVQVLVAVRESRAYLALNRCYICPPVGYGYDGEFLVCLNCGAPISPETVGTPGGCNPVVVEYALEGGSFVLSAEKLAEAWER